MAKRWKIMWCDSATNWPIFSKVHPLSVQFVWPSCVIHIHAMCKSAWIAYVVSQYIPLQCSTHDLHEYYPTLKFVYNTRTVSGCSFICILIYYHIRTDTVLCLSRVFLSFYRNICMSFSCTDMHWLHELERTMFFTIYT